MRVIADHLRATTFLIADGVLPSNEGRGYVLRRILRRAARHGKMLGLAEPFLHQGVDVVVEAMQGAYPELATHLEFVRRVTKVEEERFTHTLELGLGLLQEVMEKAKKAGAPRLGGEDLFRLYDTYGFPLDLAGEIAEEQGLGLDQRGLRGRDAHPARARPRLVGRLGRDGGRRRGRSCSAGCRRRAFTGYTHARGRGEGRRDLPGRGARRRPPRPATRSRCCSSARRSTPRAAGRSATRGEIRSEKGLLLVADTKKPWKGYVLHRGQARRRGRSPRATR